MIETILVWFLGIFGTLAMMLLFYEFVRFAFLVLRDDIRAMRDRKKRRMEKFSQNAERRRTQNGAERRRTGTSPSCHFNTLTHESTADK